MSHELHAGFLEEDDLSGCSALLSASSHLPLAYLPGISREGCAILELCLLQRIVNRTDADAFVVKRENVAVGLAVMHALPWDSGIYGMPMGRIAALYAMPGAFERSVKQALLDVALDTARARGYVYLDFQPSCADLPSIHAACEHGFELMDTHLAIVWDLSKPPPRPETRADLRAATLDDAELAGALAARAVPPLSRFFVDPRLPREKAVEVFRRWGENSVRGFADLVHIGLWEGEPAGLCTWKCPNEPAEFTGKSVANLNLTSVLPEMRGHGVLKAMVHAGLETWRAQGIHYAQVLTHAVNTGMHRVCGAALGGRTLAARHGMHWHAPR